jgi:hypothetical protein
MKYEYSQDEFLYKDIFEFNSKLNYYKLSSICCLEIKSNLIIFQIYIYLGIKIIDSIK